LSFFIKKNSFCSYFLFILIPGLSSVPTIYNKNVPGFDNVTVKEEDPEESSLFNQEDSYFADDLDDNNDFSKIRTKSKKDKKGKKLDAQALAVKRHKLWLLMSRKEVIKSQRTRATVHKEQLHSLKRVAVAASKAVKQKALQVNPQSDWVQHESGYIYFENRRIF